MRGRGKDVSKAGGGSWCCPDRCVQVGVLIEIEGERNGKEKEAWEREGDVWAGERERWEEREKVAAAWWLCVGLDLA